MPLCTMSLHLTLDLQIQLDKFLLIEYQNGKEAWRLLFFCDGVRFKSHLILLFFAERCLQTIWLVHTPGMLHRLTFTPCVCDVMHTSSILGFVVDASLPPGCTKFMRLYLAPCVTHTHTLHPLLDLCG